MDIVSFILKFQNEKNPKKTFNFLFVTPFLLFPSLFSAYSNTGRNSKYICVSPN